MTAYDDSPETGDSAAAMPRCFECRSPMRASTYPEPLPGGAVVFCDRCGVSCLEADARAFDVAFERTRRSAFELVERELRGFRPTLDIQIRGDHVTLTSIETARGETLLDAIDQLRDKSRAPFPPKD